jgi:hypothetical protein
MLGPGFQGVLGLDAQAPGVVLMALAIMVFTHVENEKIKQAREEWIVIARSWPWKEI